MSGFCYLLLFCSLTHSLSLSLSLSRLSASGSPKLLTPSEFTSPAKVELSPLQSSSLPPLTPPPAAIPPAAAQEPDKPDSPESVPTGQASLTSNVASSPLTVTSGTPSPPIHKAPGTQTSATLTSVTEFSLTDEADHKTEADTTAQLSELSSRAEIGPIDVDNDGKQPQVPLQSESHDQSHDQSRDQSRDQTYMYDLTIQEGEEKKTQHSGIDEGNGATNVSQKKAESNNEEKMEGELSTRDVQESMNNIFKLLAIENPHSTAEDSQHVDFEEFTKLLNDPALVQQGPLTSTEKSISLGGEGPKSDEFVPLAPRSSKGEGKSSSSLGVEDDSSEIVNATGAPTPAEHLQLLKENIPPAESDKVPLLSDLGVTDESIEESLAEQKKAEGEGEEIEEAPWPDIGQPEPDMEVKVVCDDKEIESALGPALQMNDSGGDGSPVTTTATVGAAIVPSVATGDEEGGVPPVVSEELPPVVIERLPPVVGGLIMPSADVAIDIAAVENVEKSHDIPVRSHDQGQQLPQEELSERDGTPGLPEQEGEGLEQEVGGGTLPTELVSKSKKKTRRGSRGKGKKANVGNATLGTTGLVEVIG